MKTKKGEKDRTKKQQQQSNPLPSKTFDRNGRNGSSN